MSVESASMQYRHERLFLPIPLLIAGHSKIAGNLLNAKIKACALEKSGVYIKVNEHFVEGEYNAEFGVFGGCL